MRHTRGGGIFLQMSDAAGDTTKPLPSVCEGMVIPLVCSRLSSCSVFVCITAILLFLGVGDTRAAPPPNADGTYRTWFQSLRQPQTGLSCCSISDCRMTDYRGAQDGYEVLLEGRWFMVPAEKILRGIQNPTGRAVVCASTYRDANEQPVINILCFVTPEES